MDRASLRILNILLGNDENEAAVELHFPAGEIVFEAKCTFALTGADFDPNVNGFPIAMGKTYLVEEGDVLGFKKRITGQRAYLGVVGGFEVTPWLGSRSTNLAAHIGGYNGRPVLAGDRLEQRKRTTPASPVSLRAGHSLIDAPPLSPSIRVTAGPEYDWLTPLSTEKLLSEPYRISRDSNRMGYRTDGEPLCLLDELEMISTAVNFGTIQLLPNGQLVILMADHQTTGGYPRIGQVIRRDLSTLAQLGPGDRLFFELVSISEAEELDLELEKRLAVLKVGRRLKISE